VSNGNRRWLAVLGGVLILAVVVGLSNRVLGSRESTSTSPIATVEPAAGGQQLLDGEQTSGVAGARSSSQDPTPTPDTSSPRVVLPPTPVIQWETLTFSLQNFRPGETVVLSVESAGAMKEIGRVEVDGQGKVADARITLPSWLESGKHQMEAAGTSGETKATGTLYIRAKELWINLKDYTLHEASKTGFIAGGFEPGDRIAVYLTNGGDSASQRPLVTVSADEVGNTAWTEVEVPVMPAGKYDLLLKGETTRGELRTAVSVAAPTPELALSPWSGLPGRKVDLNAKGFLPGEQVDVFLGQDRQPILNLQADQFGDLWGAGPVTIPIDSQGGQLPIIMRGRMSQSEVTSEFTVIGPDPWMELSSYADFPGTAVTANGGGFASGERLTLHVGSATSPVVAEGVAGDDGSYRGLGPAQVPADAQGQVTFVVVGESSHTETQATFKVLQPFVSLTPTTE